MIEFKAALNEIQQALDCDDIIIRKLNLAGTSCALVYVDALSDKMLLEQDIIQPLLRVDKIEPTAEYIQSIVQYGETIKTSDDINDALETIAKGDICLLVDKSEEYFFISLKQFNFRSVTEPPTELVLHGPREGFIEDIKVNISLVRRKLKTPKLRVKQLCLGKQSNTTVAIVYLDDIADPETVKEVTHRVASIEMDGVISSGYVERYVEKYNQSIFPQTGITEKPDIVVAKLLEGRVAILIDGTPVAITVPFLLFEGFQDSYDYYCRDWRASMLRVFRVIGALLSICLPGIYVAVQEFHYHLLPLKFMISVLNAISGIPFTPPMEMLFVLILFEVLNQASVRMPKYVGTALSIVGAIVLGDTAVQAGLLSSPAVLIVAISAIGINCVPELADTFSILRLALLLAGSVLGLFGVIVFLVLILTYLCSLQSYGTPYLAPFAPLITSDLKDAIIKDSIKGMGKRPYSVSTNNRRRLRNDK